MGIDFDAGKSAKCMCIVWFDFCFVILFIHKLKAWYSRYNWSISEWIPLKLEKLTRTNKDVTVRMITPSWLTGWALHLYLQLRLHGGLLQQQDSGLKGERELIFSHTKFDFRRQKKMHKADFARDQEGDSCNCGDDWPDWRDQGQLVEGKGGVVQCSSKQVINWTILSISGLCLSGPVQVQSQSSKTWTWSITLNLVCPAISFQC